MPPALAVFSASVAPLDVTDGVVTLVAEAAAAWCFRSHLGAGCGYICSIDARHGAGAGDVQGAANHTVAGNVKVGAGLLGGGVLDVVSIGCGDT